MIRKDRDKPVAARFARSQDELTLAEPHQEKMTGVSVIELECVTKETEHSNFELLAFNCLKTWVTKSFFCK